MLLPPSVHVTFFFSLYIFIYGETIHALIAPLPHPSRHTILRRFAFHSAESRNPFAAIIISVVYTPAVLYIIRANRDVCVCERERNIGFIANRTPLSSPQIRTIIIIMTTTIIIIVIAIIYIGMIIICEFRAESAMYRPNKYPKLFSKRLLRYIIAI